MYTYTVHMNAIARHIRRDATFLGEKSSSHDNNFRTESGGRKREREIEKRSIPKQRRPKKKTHTAHEMNDNNDDDERQVRCDYSIKTGARPNQRILMFPTFSIHVRYTCLRDNNFEIDDVKCFSNRKTIGIGTHTDIYTPFPVLIEFYVRRERFAFVL